jgi:nucleotide-binding universal stress UspA family protein
VSYGTLLVHLQIGCLNSGLLNIARDLSQRYDSRVIGIAAGRPLDFGATDGFAGGMVYISGEAIQQDRDELDREIAAAEAEFHVALSGRVSAIEWRSSVTYEALSDCLVRQARSADLILSNMSSPGSDPSRRVDTGDLVMRSGRPLLIVPRTLTSLDLDHVLVAWKDTREARRAVADALPLLKQAAHVTVHEVSIEDDLVSAHAQVDDVRAWLARHGIVAETSVSMCRRGDAAYLDAIATELSADVIVAGVYGHNRMHEWVFGGVTRDLLLVENRCALVSH